jgi:hypothetical protein
MQAAALEQLSLVQERPHRQGGDGSMVPRILVDRVLRGNSVLVLELRHTGSTQESEGRRPARPELSLVANQCPAPTPRFEGEVAFAGTGRLVLALSELPQGRLTFQIDAFDSRGGVVLANDAQGLRVPAPGEPTPGERTVPAGDGSGALVREVGPATCPERGKSP